MGKIYKNGILFAGSTENARSVAFDNADTGLEAANVQGAIEEINNAMTVTDVTDSIVLENGITMRYGTLYKVGNLMILNCLLTSETAYAHNKIWMTIPEAYRPQHNLNGPAGAFTENSYTNVLWSINHETGVLRCAMESDKTITQLRLNICWVV